MAGKLVHFELPAKDSARSTQFYSALFGWEFQAHPGADYHMIQFDEQSGGAVSGTESGETHPTIYFDVDDIDAAMARVRELGGEAGEKMPVPGMGWFVPCKDTEGTSISLWQSDDSAPMPA